MKREELKQLVERVEKEGGALGVKVLWPGDGNDERFYIAANKIRIGDVVSRETPHSRRQECLISHEGISHTPLEYIREVRVYGPVGEWTKVED